LVGLPCGYQTHGFTPQRPHHNQNPTLSAHTQGDEPLFANDIKVFPRQRVRIKQHVLGFVKGHAIMIQLD
jgi:hypothetical protein